jgi:hypothetical protein
VRINPITPLPLFARRRSFVLATAAAAALAISGLPLLTAPAQAASPAVTLTGSIRSLPANSASIVVRAELAMDVNSAGVPRELIDVPVARATVTSASPAFSIPVPDSATLRQAEAQRHGIVNFNILVTSGTRQTSEYVPAALAVSAAAGNIAELTVQRTHQVRIPAFPPFRTATAAELRSALAGPDNGPTCVWDSYGSLYQDRTRIGEAHVADVSGVSDTFWFKNQNDMTISVGFSNSPSSGYSFDGNIGLTNSLSANGSYTFGAGAVDYVNDTTNYQRYEAEAEGHSCNEYMIQAVGSDADVYPGTNTPPVNPWGGCTNDPLYATLAPGGTWSRDQSSAESYSGIATVFGFSFGGSDGFTTDVEHDYSAQGASEYTYICGPKDGEPPTSAPILYNTP